MTPTSWTSRSAFEAGRWELLGDGVEYRMSVEHADLLEAIRNLGGTAKTGDVAAAVGKTVAGTSKLLCRQADGGAINRGAYGTHSLINTVEPVQDLAPNDRRLEPLQPLQPTSLMDPFAEPIRHRTAAGLLPSKDGDRGEGPHRHPEKP